MNAQRLKYFIAIVEEGSISRAAKRLFMAQPPLSQQLKQLEAQLGVTLIERDTRSLVVTKEGELLYKRAKEILELMDVTEKQLKELKEGVRGMLAIGTIPSLGSEILPPKILKFQEQYPDVQFNIWEGDPNRIMELLENRIIDIGIVRRPFDNEVFEKINLPDEPQVVAMSPKLNIGGSRQYIKLAELENKPLMLLRRLKGTSTYNHKLYMMDNINDAFIKSGLKPNIICESNDIPTLLNWANHGIGITIVPKSAMNLMPHSGLIYKEIVEPPIFARSPALIWLKDRHLPTVSKKFLDYFSAENLDGSMSM